MIAAMDVSSLITALGGAKAVAARVRVGRAAVGMWVVRDEVPAAHRLEVWQMALEAGVAWEPQGASELRGLLSQPTVAAA